MGRIRLWLRDRWRSELYCRAYQCPIASYYWGIDAIYRRRLLRAICCGPIHDGDWARPENKPASLVERIYQVQSSSNRILAYTLCSSGIVLSDPDRSGCVAASRTPRVSCLRDASCYAFYQRNSDGFYGGRTYWRGARVAGLCSSETLKALRRHTGKPAARSVLGVVALASHGLALGSDFATTISL